jgi:hypothetical protein
MRALLEQIYFRGDMDNWAGSLIMAETAKVHETVKSVVDSLSKILCAPNASKEDKQWARDKISGLIG